MSYILEHNYMNKILLMGSILTAILGGIMGGLTAKNSEVFGAAPRVLVETQGGTGTSTPQKILYGDNGNIISVGLGSGLTLTGDILSASGGVSYFSDLGDVSTSTPAAGDIYYLNSSGQVTNLGIGSANQLLKVSGGLPSWSSYTSSTGSTSEYTSSTDSFISGTLGLFGGEYTTNNSLCVALTGSADLCDGADASGGGGGGTSWTESTHYGETVFATDTPVWFQDNMYVSSSKAVFETVSTSVLEIAPDSSYNLSTILPNSTWLASSLAISTSANPDNAVAIAPTNVAITGGDDGWVILGSRVNSSATTNDYFVCIGYLNTCSNQATSIGGLSSAQGQGSIALGYAASIASAGASNSIAIGNGTGVTGSNAIAIGVDADNSSNNTAIIGGQGMDINTFIIGAQTDVSPPSQTTIKLSMVGGANTAAPDLYLQPGTSNGTGAPADIYIQTSVAGASGAVAQTHYTRLAILGETGYVGVATSTPRDLLHVSNGTSGTTSTMWVGDLTGSIGQICMGDGDGSGATCIGANNGSIYSFTTSTY